MGHPLGRQLPPRFIYLQKSIQVTRGFGIGRGRGGVGSGCGVLGSLGVRGVVAWAVGLFEEFGRVGSLSEAMQYNAGSRSVGERRPPGLYWDVWGGLPRTDTAWLCLYRLCLV